MVKDPVCGMEVDESRALGAVQDKKSYYFCSVQCLNKFCGYEEPSISCCPSEKNKKWFQNKTFLSAFTLFVILGLSYFWPVLVPFRETVLLYFGRIWWAILLGLLIGGLIDYYIPREVISSLLAQPKKRTVFYSVGLGFLGSVCSHGILALSMGLYKKGAATSSVIAFLLASPWAGLPITLLLISLFGFLKALYVIAAALVIAVTTGLIYQILESRGWVESNKNTVRVDANYAVLEDLKKRIRDYKFSPDQLREDIKGIARGTWGLADMILWWLILGVSLASLSGAFIPAFVFQKYMGPTVVGFLVTLGLATVLEVCSECSSPLAFEIFRQTGALGNSLVFLMAGVATDYTEIGLIWQNIGRRAALWLPAITVPQIIFWGILANIIF